MVSLLKTRSSILSSMTVGESYRWPTAAPTPTPANSSSLTTAFPNSTTNTPSSLRYAHSDPGNRRFRSARPNGEGTSGRQRPSSQRNQNTQNHHPRQPHRRKRTDLTHSIPLIPHHLSLHITHCHLSINFALFQLNSCLLIRTV